MYENDNSPLNNKGLRENDEMNLNSLKNAEKIKKVLVNRNDIFFINSISLLRLDSSVSQHIIKKIIFYKL